MNSFKVLFIIVLFYSCRSLPYGPLMLNSPLISEPGEIHVQGGISTSTGELEYERYEGALIYSPIKNNTIQSQIYFNKAAKTFRTNIGYGYKMLPFENKKLPLEIFFGIGYGKIKYSAFAPVYMAGFEMPEVEFEAQYKGNLYTTFLQIAIGAISAKNIIFVWGFRILYANFIGYQNRLYEIEYGVEEIKYNIPYKNESFYFSLAPSIRINYNKITFVPQIGISWPFHKATTGNRLSTFNVFCGVSLLTRFNIYN